MKRFIVQEELNKRIDNYLSEKNEDLSRVTIQRLIQEEEILVTEEIYDRYTVGDYFEEKNNLGNEITNEI